jgi:hypothetical protein
MNHGEMMGILTNQDELLVELWSHGAVKPQSFCTVNLFFCLAIDNDHHNNKKNKTRTGGFTNNNGDLLGIY